MHQYITFWGAVTARRAAEGLPVKFSHSACAERHSMVYWYKTGSIGEKRMQYKILASDYDNTLMPFGEAKPRPAVVKAVKKLQAAGGKFVLSTGRSYPGIRDKNQLGGIRYDYAITCNGACVVDREGRIVAEHPLTAEEMYALVDFCEDYNYPLQFNFRDACYAYCEYCLLYTSPSPRDTR